ncbi:protein CNGC15b [Cryptomeria japonica]|uniref:protein CNGC15b n=1 Tax=Cryptomeria japonica TaxID=3369 RepID=UPI0027D9FFCC|nr:protein CNGC15b [Cryptomeria japonica]XP_057821103.2 protein CNGC15b [Cryptomeria japonica]
MEFKNKSVRFHRDLDSGMSTWGNKDEVNKTGLKSFQISTPNPLKKPDGFADLGRPLHFGKSKIFADDSVPLRRRILDPGDELVQRWNKIFLISSLTALFLDPLYFYLPLYRSDNACMQIDRTLAIVVTVFRSIADLFYILHMILKFRTAYIAPSSRVFGRGELVIDPAQIAKRYLKTDFFLDLVALLPLPQLVIWSVIPALRRSSADHTKNVLAMIVLFQYFPRLFLIFPLTSEIVRTTGVVTKTAWAGAAYNLLLYMLASHVLGASWYLLAVERQNTCWRSECKSDSISNCQLDFLDCDSLSDGLSSARQQWMNTTQVINNCDANNSTITFNFGIYGGAWQSGIVSSKFLEKYFFCFWWGLRNLSSVGQNLVTSTYIWENSFAIVICIVGLVLFAHLIGNMQTYLQSLTVRLEEWRVKRRDTEEWMRHRQLPQDLRERVRRYVQYKWVATRGVDEETLLRGLPTDLRRDIQRHLCLNLVRRVPFFSQMDDQLIDAICERLTPALSTEGTYIVREGDPVNEMLFIIRGYLDSATTNGGRTGFFNSITLGPGDFCGEELLTWALLPKSSLNLPSSTRTVRALVEVEAFALRAEDLKFVANQFRRLHSKKLQHTFRFYSHQWRTWSACFIQAAWRRYKKRKLAAELLKKESFYYYQKQELEPSHDFATSADDANAESYGTPSTAMAEVPQNNPLLGATLLASRFAANTRRGVLRTRAMSSHGANDQMPKLQKPEEPNFSAEVEDE